MVGWCVDNGGYQSAGVWDRKWRDGDLGLQVFLREPGIWEKCLREGEETCGASEAGILDSR